MGASGSTAFLSDRRADGLHFGVHFQSFVAHLAAPSGLLVSAEWQRRVEHVVAVDPHRPGAQFVRYAMSLADVAGPDTGGETVFAVVGFGHKLVDVAERRGHHYRPEAFLA